MGWVGRVCPCPQKRAIPAPVALKPFQWLEIGSCHEMRKFLCKNLKTYSSYHIKLLKMEDSFYFFSRKLLYFWKRINACILFISNSLLWDYICFTLKILWHNIFLFYGSFTNILNWLRQFFIFSKLHIFAEVATLGTRKIYCRSQCSNTGDNDLQKKVL